MTKLPEYEIIRASRNSISIQINIHGKLIVKAPRIMPKFLIQKFVESKADWILKSVNKTVTASAKDEFLYLGNSYILTPSNVKEITVSDKLYFPNFLMFRMKMEITAWYINEAKRIITSRVIYYSNVMNKQYKSISYSDTISKWGSCAPDNRLQFNWRLIMAPMLVLDYVVVHELAHTVEKNHGPRFWRIVEEYKPAYKQYVKWLKTNAYRLHTV